MTAASEAPSLETVRWYTSARRFPQLIGRTADGARIPGGPYTVTQAIGGGLVLVLAAKTTGLWMRFGLVPSIILLAGIFGAVVVGLGLIPHGARNPLSIAAGAMHAVAAPAYGRVAGQKVQPPRPIRVRHRILIAPDIPLGAAEIAAEIAADSTSSYAAPAPVDGPQVVAEVPVVDAFLEDLLASAPAPVPPRPAGDGRAPLTGVQALLAAAPPTVRDATRSQESSR